MTCASFPLLRRLAGISALLVLAFATDATAAPDCTGMNQAIHQSVNPAAATNLLSPWTSEIDTAAAQHGFTDKRGIAFLAQLSPAPELVAFHRLYNAANHDFLWSRNPAGATGYQDQGVAFYAALTPTPRCNLPVYRYVLGGKHRFASQPHDRDLLRAGGWTEEGVMFWARANPVFSIAILPDTQREVQDDASLPRNTADTRFINRTQWLAAHRYDENLQFVLHSGDVVNWGERDAPQYTVASEGMKPLEQVKLPYVLSIGNHDTRAVCKFGSACPGEQAWVTVRETPLFNQTFAQRFGRVQGQFESGKLGNVYSTFDAGGVQWLVLSLELWPRASVVSWADDVVKAHPTRNVIVVTHSFLDSNGNLRTDNGGYGSTSPQYLYDHLIKRNANIRFVFSGHEGQATSRELTGDAGNRVVAFLQAFHSVDANPVRLLQINTDTGSALSYVYAPNKGAFWSQYDKQFSGMNYVKP